MVRRIMHGEPDFCFRLSRLLWCILLGILSGFWEEKEILQILFSCEELCQNFVNFAYNSLRILSSGLCRCEVY